MTQVPYSYVTLRYVHDMTTREFVNVGVVLFSPEAKFVGAKVLPRSNRVKAMFPDVAETHLANLLSHVQAQIEILRTNIGSNPKAKSASQIEALVTSVLPRDESSLQWGEVGGGICENARATLESLFQRLVMKYERERTVQRIQIRVEMPREASIADHLQLFALTGHARIVGMPQQLSVTGRDQTMRKSYAAVRRARRNGDVVSG